MVKDSRPPFVKAIEQVLTPDECAELIEKIEDMGPSQAPITTARGFEYHPEVRNNSRVMFDDPALANQIFERVKGDIPDLFENWLPVGANERLRCYRYEPGQFFAPHFDGSFERSADERSLLTLMVYLNDVEAGGETRFPPLAHSIAPAAGQALLFDHGILHESRPVRAGVKYAVRSDVMFRRR